VSNKLGRVFRLAAKHYATSLSLWLAATPLFVGGLVFTELSEEWIPSSVGPVLLIGTFAHLAVGVIFWLGGKTLLHPSRRDSAGWKEVVSVFALAGAARGFSIGLLIEALGLGQADYLIRVTTAIVLVGFSFTFSAYSAQLWREYRVKRRQLLISLAVGERTDALRGIAATEFRPLALGNLEQDVLKAREQTMVALESIRDRVRSEELDPIGIQEVFNASDNNWRNLSHKAWVAGLPNVPKIDLSEIVKTLASSKPISLIVLSAGPAYGFTRIFDDLPIATAILGGLIWWLGVVGIAIATNHFAASFREGGVFILLGGFVAIQVCAFLVGQALLEGLSAQSEVWYVSLVSSLVAVGLGLPPALERSGQVVLDQLERRLNNTAMKNLKAQGEMFVLAQRIGGYLHSEVRGDFLRHSLALREALEAGNSDEAEKILDQLDHLVGTINLEESEKSPLENLTAFLSNWSGVIRVTHNLEEMAISHQFQRSVEVIVMEAVNNAVRHGNSTWVQITGTETLDSLELQIDSDSEPFAQNPSRGLGTQTLDRLAPGRWSWHFVEVPEKTPIFQLKVSLSSHTD
jgi:hypothetical protein